MKKIHKKILSLVLVLLLCFSNAHVYILRAQEESPSPEPEVTIEPSSSPEAETEITNDAVVVDDVVSDANTGENEITIVEASSSPSPEQTPLDVKDYPTGASPSPTPIAEIVTGDAVSVTEVENNVNTNVVNSVFLNHTLNIFIQDSYQNLDLSLLVQNAVEKVFENDGNLEEEVSVVALGINNFAYLENNIDASADTGGNSIEGLPAGRQGDGGGEITTGDAYSVVSVINNVNTNIVDSTFHTVTINIFGDYVGDIVLPELNETNQGCNNCTGDTVVNNTATVTNNVDSSAITGQNSITTTSASESAEITTGNAQSVVNVYNLVNTNWIGVVFKQIYINTFGSWIGEFLGWGDILATSDKDIEILSNTPNTNSDQGCENCYDDINIQNNATVVNNISSTANTGGNNIAGGGNIKTGNSYSSITLANFVNSNIINSTGFIGFINIFGTLTGNIGGAEAFVKVEEVEEVEEVKVNQSQEENQPETGAELLLDASHNVGAYVLPGDTITFTAKVKNPGNATLKDTKVFIELFKDDISYGGSFFNLGDIKPFKSLTLSTGLVLSKDAEAGDYVAVVSATGFDGDGTELSDLANLPFVIVGFTPKEEDEGLVAGVSASDGLTPPTVMGVNTAGLTDLEKRLIALFSGLLFVYLMGRAYQKREIYVYPAFRKVGDYALRIGSLLT